MSALIRAQLEQYQQLSWMGIFLIALAGMLGSLYYSTFGDPVVNIMTGTFLPIGAGLEPCLLCWFARILLYPIVPISYIGILKKDRHFTDYLLPMVGLGIVLEMYHYAIQKLPLRSIFGCSLENPCSALQVNYFGFLTIPLLCLLAFLGMGFLIGVSMWVNIQLDEKKDI